MKRIERSGGWRAEAAVLISILAVLAFGAALPHAPRTFENAWGFAPESARVSGHAAVGLTTPWPQPDFVLTLRVALGCSWAAWALALVALARSPGIGGSLRVWAVAAAASPAVMMFFPPLLSRDVLGYVGYGRLPGLYGLNPYVAGRTALESLNDPSASFLVWDTPLPYGPMWTVFAAAVARAGAHSGGVWLEVLLHKGAAATALLLTAAAGGRLAAARDPEFELPARIAIASSPLLLVEGPGSGHNDAMMSAFMIGGGLATARRRHAVAALLLGAAVAIKPVAVVAVPLLVVERLLAGEQRGRCFGLAVLCLVPTVALSTLYGGPATLVEAVFRRAAAQPSRPLLPIAVVAATGLVASVWLLRQYTHRHRPAAWLAAWIPLALVIAVVALPVRFPWYMTWALSPALTDFDRRSLPVLAVVLVLSVLLMWQYTVPL